MIERGADGAGFEDMAPFSGVKAAEALKTLVEARDWARDLSKLIPAEMAHHLVSRWKEATTVEAFQEQVVKPFLEGLMDQTTQGVTWHAAEGSMDEGMLFLSNHRDIVLDPSLINVALLEHGRGSTEIGIGSNLLSSEWVNQLVRLNRCFVVERSGSARERYEHSLRTAAYIHHVTQFGTPVWLAHREGRAKDGRDTTAPALVRTLSNNGDASTWDDLRVVPVSISYEWDPCDAMKVHELLHHAEHGSYEKAPGEDELSMWTGLAGQKGRVHLEFGRILNWHAAEEDRKPERAMANTFDLHLHEGMKRWPNQRLAAEHLGLSTDVYSDCPEATTHDLEAWTRRKDWIADTLSERGWSREQAVAQWCRILSAPLAMRQALLNQG